MVRKVAWLNHVSFRHPSVTLCPSFILLRRCLFRPISSTLKSTYFHAPRIALAMSQEYFSGTSGSSAGEGSSRHPPQEESSENPFFSSPPPAYMTVGNGSTSESATALMASLNQDSGYGGSNAGGSLMDGHAGSGWRPELMVDRPTPQHTPTLPGEWNPAGLSHPTDIG